MENQKRDKNFIINFIAIIIQTIINYGISLLFTPYLISFVGSEAYGFVNLTNNMVNYATILTIALSSVAGRFVTIMIHQNKIEDANKYFNSVIIANCILSVFIIIIFIPIIIYLEYLLNIPIELIDTVKLLFVFIVLNFVISIISNIFTVGTFISNKLFYTNVGNCISALLRIFLLWFMYDIFAPSIVYVGIASCACTIFLAIYNYCCTIKLKVGLFLNFKYFSIKHIIEMIGAGIWSSITKLSQLLSDGLDLLISNIWVGSYAMGQLSIAYTIPTLCASVLNNIASIFNPQQTYYYAKGDINGVVSETKKNMKITGFFMGIIFAGIISMGYEFFSLWTPKENISLIYTLASISILSVLLSGVASALNSIFLITNKLKVNSIVWLVISFINCFIVYILVRFFDLGVYAVAGVSKITAIILYLTYTPIYASYCLNISKKTFYPIILKYISVSIILTIVLHYISSRIGMSCSWYAFLVKALLIGCVGLVFNGIFFLNREDRIMLFSTLKNKFVKKKLKV